MMGVHRGFLNKYLVLICSCLVERKYGVIRGKCLAISYDTYLLLWQLTTCRVQENQNTCVTESSDVVFRIETNCHELFVKLA